MSSVPSYLEEITLEDVSSHIYELYINSAPSDNQDLGIISRKDHIEVSISDTDYEFKQSISNLNNSSSSTGFVLWRVSIPFVKWISSSKLYDFKDKYVVEVGAGVTGLIASIIGKHTKHYISTDQYHLTKLLKSNIVDNVECFKSSTMESQGVPRKKQVIPTLDVCTYDWENIDQGLYEIRTLNSNEPDYIIGCDIVYNDYLIPFLVDAIENLAGLGTKILIGLQLRLPENIEIFVQTLLERGLSVYKHEREVLHEELRNGFVVYYITK